MTRFYNTFAVVVVVFCCVWAEILALCRLCCSLTLSWRCWLDVFTLISSMASASRTSAGKMSESEDQYKRVFLLLTLIWQTILQRRVQPQLVCVFCRKLVIKCSSYKQAQWWSHEIRSLSESCDFLQTHRFEGFRPSKTRTRSQSGVCIYVICPWMNFRSRKMYWVVCVMEWVLSKWLIGWLTGMLMETAISQTWLMPWNRPRRRSSSLIGGKCTVFHTHMYSTWPEWISSFICDHVMYTNQTHCFHHD